MDFLQGRSLFAGFFSFSKKIFEFLTKTVRNTVQNMANEAGSGRPAGSVPRKTKTQAKPRNNTEKEKKT